MKNVQALRCVGEGLRGVQTDFLLNSLPTTLMMMTMKIMNKLSTLDFNFDTNNNSGSVHSLWSPIKSTIYINIPLNLIYSSLFLWSRARVWLCTLESDDNLLSISQKCLTCFLLCKLTQDRHKSKLNSFNYWITCYKMLTYLLVMRWQGEISFGKYEVSKKLWNTFSTQFTNRRYNHKISNYKIHLMFLTGKYWQSFIICLLLVLTDHMSWTL